jgi:hypothetical protein
MSQCRGPGRSGMAAGAERSARHVSSAWAIELGCRNTRWLVINRMTPDNTSSLIPTGSSPVRTSPTQVRYASWFGLLSSRMAYTHTFTSRSSIVTHQFGEGFLVLQIDTGLQSADAVGRQSKLFASTLIGIAPEHCPQRVVQHRAKRSGRSRGQDFRFGEQVVIDIDGGTH